jgi:hypothetical protein
MYFQVQLSMMTENFDFLMQSLSESVLPDLARQIEEFNEMRTETTQELIDMNANPTCFTEWERTQTNFGRSLSSCAEISTYELIWMLSYQGYLTWYAEYYTNMVAVEGLEAFTYWYPLSDDNTDINRVINNQMRYSLDEFIWYHYAELVWFENYVFDYFSSIGYRSYFCAYSLIGRFYSENVYIINDATDGTCS